MLHKNEELKSRLTKTIGALNVDEGIKEEIFKTIDLIINYNEEKYDVLVKEYSRCKDVYNSLIYNFSSKIDNDSDIIECYRDTLNDVIEDLL